MPQFFIKKENIQEDKILITNSSDINHITNVLRHRKKDRLILSGPENFVYEAEIVSIKPDLIETQITDRYFSDKTLKISITLAQSIIKSQKQDFLIQKATELGVRTIIPFISKNTVVKFDSEKDKISKVQRWQKIVYESAKQCKRGDLAEIKPVSTFDEVINLEGFDLKIVCSEKEDAFSIKQFLSKHKIDDFLSPPPCPPPQGGGSIIGEGASPPHLDTPKCFNTPESAHYRNILLVIGPEGGWDDKEINKFTEKGFASVTLGKLVYRAETAATVAISHIIYEYEL